MVDIPSEKRLEQPYTCTMAGGEVVGRGAAVRWSSIGEAAAEA